MNRKCAALCGTLAVVVFATGVSFANQDEDTPLHKLMENVQKNNSTILKYVNAKRETSTTPKRDAVVAASSELHKLAKEARALGEGPAKEKKKTVSEWEKLTDSFIKESDDFAKVFAKPATTKPEAKEAFRKVTKSCSECHDVFRPE